MKGVNRHKVVSSGRLTGAGRGQPARRRTAAVQTHWPLCAEPAYSLYSSDSEDQVTTVHKGLDRCAALLDVILQTEKTEAKVSFPKSGKPAAVRTRALSSIVKERGEIGRKKMTKKSVKMTVPAPVEKTVLSSESNPGIRPAGPTAPFNPEVPLFNGRLTTSTPTLSPERPQSTKATLPATTTTSSGPRAPSIQVVKRKTPLPRRSSGHRVGAVRTATPEVAPLLFSDPSPAPSLAQSGSGVRTLVGQGIGGVANPSFGASSVDNLAAPAPLPGTHRCGDPTPLSCSCSVQLCEKHALLPQFGSLSLPQQSAPMAPTNDEPQLIPACHVPLSQPHSPPTTLLPTPLSSNSPRPLLTSHRPLYPKALSPRAQPITPPSPGPRFQTKEEEAAKAPKAPSSQSGSRQGREASLEERSGGSAGDSGAEDEEDEEGVDTRPVRDTSSQTGLDQRANDHRTNPDTLMGEAASQRGMPVAQTHRATEPTFRPVNTQQTQSGAPLMGGSEDSYPEQTAVKVMTAQYLLGELKALVSGQGSAAQRLVSDLEQTVSLLPVMVGSSNVQAEIALAVQPLRSENATLRRRLRILNQQLQERERAEREARSLHDETEVTALQMELGEAQIELQQLQGDITALRQALEVTQSQLLQSKAENEHIRNCLEDSSSRLAECEREKSELVLVAQQRQTEIHRLQELTRIRQDPLSNSPNVIDVPLPRPVLTKQTLAQYQDRREQSEPVPDPVSQYLSSLNHRGRGPFSPPCKGPSHLAKGENAQLANEVRETACMDSNVCVTNQDLIVCGEERDEITFAPLQENVKSSVPEMRSQPGGGATASTTDLQTVDRILKLLHQPGSLTPLLDQSNGVTLTKDAPLNQSQNFRRRLDMGSDSTLDCSMSSCDVKSQACDLSRVSSSTFDTRDEQDFRDGLAALDACIASMQKTIQLDMSR